MVMNQDLELYDTPYYEKMHEVVTHHLEGRNATWIAKTLNMRRTEVQGYIEHFNQVAKSDEMLRDRAQEVVHEFDEQHNRIIAKMWEVVREAELKGDLKTQSSSVKALSDITAKRVEVLQKSGLLSDAKIGDEMARMEEEHEQLIAILKDVTN